MSSQAPPDPPPPGPVEESGGQEPKRFGSYFLIKELGRGAQGVVFLAEHSGLRRKVALKMLTGAGAQSQLVRDRFRREAELTSKFEHPGICGVHDFGEVDGLPFIAMQYVRGTTLAALVEKGRADSKGEGPSEGSDTITIGGGGNKGGLEDVLRLVERAARALHVAHEAGLVHRDIKPANIMVTLEGHPVLLDFGLARDLESEGQGLTQSGQILGTPAYLAPEQIVASRGVVDRRTDVYALGVTLFECLTLQRPFEGSSWDQLFHEILEGASRNPRKLNPRIPVDLATVIEVAMEREPARRYATAEALAEDLRRVRSFEPIQAKAAGPVERTIKWARRNTGSAVGAAAAILFVLLLAGFATFRAIERARDLSANLRQASDALVAADYVTAAIAVAKAQELDPDSVEVVELAARVERAKSDAERQEQRRHDLAEAVAARTEADGLRTKYAAARTRIEELGAELMKEQSGVLGQYAPLSVRGAFARRQLDKRSLESDAERMLVARSEALERASRFESPWGGASMDTQRALAAFYMERWREALRVGDSVRAGAMRAAAEAHDPRGEQTEELLGRGLLTLAVVPVAAELHLFRWEDYGSLRTGDVIPRLVPVPTTGVGRAHTGAWSGDFFPGDPCLVVRAVEPDSLAARAGLVPGDLVLRCAGEPAAESLFVRAVAADGPLAAAGVTQLARIRDVDGESVQSMFDWVTHGVATKADASAKQSATKRVRFAGVDTPVQCDPRQVSVIRATELARDPVPGPLRLDCLHAGEPVAIDVPVGSSAGLDCEITAYPLVLSGENRIDASTTRTLDPGSYLVLADSPGYAQQRVNVRIPRRTEVAAQIELLRTEDVPAGFVYVPPGLFEAGGDREAFKPVAAHVVDVPGFFLARKELTNADWYEFVNDPRTLELIAATKPGEHLYLPQDDRVLAKRDASGVGFTFDVWAATSAETPVLGLTWNDARDYLVWRNERAAERGELWRYDLPSEVEWEKAARGVDARAFPWGDRFDPSLTVCAVRKSGFLLDAPGGFEPCDESPYGVLDMAGSREEWLSDLVEGSDPPRRRKRGGHWSSSVEALFRSASRGETAPERFAASQGLRLVARRP